MKYVLGVDEAGRGPVIGPMVMTIAACDTKAEMKLATLGIKDSKLLTPHKRKELVSIIKSHCEYKTIVVEPAEIDAACLDPNNNLNILEAQVTAKLIDSIVGRLGQENVEKVILDCPTSNAASYVTLMNRLISVDVKLIAEHKADFKYPVVAAASILAKVRRDDAIEQIKKEYNIDIGSGYPGDGLTARFVRLYHDKNYPFFRKTWATYKAAKAAASQSTLGAFAAQPELSPAVKKKKVAVESLLKEGFSEVETKGVSEVIRVKKPGVTITLYTTGKVLVQGKDAALWRNRL